jgi:hypothetical protein
MELDLVAGRALELRSERLQNPLCSSAAHHTQVGSLRLCCERERDDGYTGLKESTRPGSTRQGQVRNQNGSH